MYFLTPLCFICLKSKSELNVINSKLLTKLLYCLGEPEDFFSPISNQTKMCNECLNKLNAAFHFKKMCLSNIIQSKNYILQLENACNNCNLHKVMRLNLTDISKFKRTSEINDSEDLNFEQYSVDQTENVIVKEEILDSIYLESLGNNKSEKKYFNIDLIQSETNEIVQEKLQMPYTEVDTVESADLHLEQSSDELLGNFVFIKSEILDDMDLHKEVVVKDTPGETLQLQYKEMSKHDFCQSQEPSTIVSNEVSNKKDLLFICSICEKHFNLKIKLIHHLRIHSKTQHCCDKCQKSFTTQHTLKAHTLTHLDNKPHCCITCGKCFALRRNLKKHIFIHSKERPHSCSVCLKSFTTKNYLNLHMLIHSKKQLHSCSLCMKSFTQKSTLKQHMLIHSKERVLYSCSICKSNFTYNSALKRHMLIHSNEKLNSCSICQKSFNVKNSLTKHMLNHAKERPYSCSVCMKSFTQKSLLKQHMLSHSKERPYCCSVCMKSFTMKGTLKQHLVLHSSEQLHSCSICKTSFCGKRNLKKHNMLIHSNGRLYTCSNCEKSFCFQSSLKRHMLINCNKLSLEPYSDDQF